MNEIKCPKCGHILPAGSRFCNNCGFKIDPVNRPQNQSQRPIQPQQRPMQPQPQRPMQPQQQRPMQPQQRMPQPNYAQAQGNKKGLSAGATVGIIIGAIALLIILAIIVAAIVSIPYDHYYDDTTTVTSFHDDTTETTTEETTETTTETTTKKETTSNYKIVLNGVSSCLTEEYVVHADAMYEEASAAIVVTFDTKDTDYDGYQLKLTNEYSGEEKYIEVSKDVKGIYYYTQDAIPIIEARTFRGDPNIIHCTFSDWSTISSRKLIQSGSGLHMDQSAFDSEMSGYAMIYP
ncbi:MAG: zinc ribbon domain-containing protein [Eubacterium sp.]|nr:zinc ribbon domain-containing protein [Eubacterium sp.]